MQFHEKLDFLMHVTKTSNSALGQKIKLDASYVSRLRKGQRSAIKNPTCIRSMAAYFARNCEEEYQRQAIEGALQIRVTQNDSATFSEHIALWLLDEKQGGTAAVGELLFGFSHHNLRSAAAEVHQQNTAADQYPHADISVFYGLEGKRKAVVCFLSEVLAQDKPQTLLLHSDEATEWMTADPGFAAEWTALMSQLLSRGHRIKIIHTVSRDLDEMLSAIRQWIPLYMTGLIEPYFYPKKRDGIFRRTLLISPGVSAVVSSSVGSSIEHAANVLIRSADMVKAYTEEFNQYLRLCRPLMRVFTTKDREDFIDTLLEYEKEMSNSIIKSGSLSILTMPQELLSDIWARVGGTRAGLQELHARRQQLFEESLADHSFTEIVQTFDADRIDGGGIRVAFSEILLGSAACYTLKEYIRHLEHLLRLLEVHDNFHVHLEKDRTEVGYMAYVKEELGAIVARTSDPPIILAFNETNLATALWEFLRNMVEEKSYRQPNNAETAKKLGTYIRQLSQRGDAVSPDEGRKQQKKQRGRQRSRLLNEDERE